MLMSRSDGEELTDDLFAGAAHYRESGFLTTGKFRRINEDLPCSMHGCSRKRRWTSPFCDSHYRRIATYGSVTKGHVEGRTLYRIREKARTLIDASIAARHRPTLAALRGLEGLFRQKRVQQRSELEYLRRLAAAEANPRDVLAEVASVCDYLFRFDPEGYEDPLYLSAQIARRLLKLVPRKYESGGERRSLKRNKGVTDTVLQVTGPLVALIVSTIERDRRGRRGRNPLHCPHKRSRHPNDY